MNHLGPFPVGGDIVLQTFSKKNSGEIFHLESSNQLYTYKQGGWDRYYEV